MSASIPPYTDSQVVAIARRVTWVGFAVNAVLAALKIAAGVIGRSSAMVADGVHSLTDFVTDLIVIIMIGVSRRKANHVYQYGYGKVETFATLIIGVALGVVAIMLFWRGLDSTIQSFRGTVHPPQPHAVALWMAVVSVVSKEWLFRYTRTWGHRIGSAAVVANAWHHRSDAISSLATLAGIAGAMFLGPHWRVLDPLAAMLVSVFIAIEAVDIARPAVKELLDVSLPADLADPIRKTIRETPGVITYHHFRSRRNGPRIIIDVHIKVNPDITVKSGHAISSLVEERLKKSFGSSIITNIHIEPYLNQPIFADGSCKD
ncbi:MAG: cation diffusion facilitator family transporter [Firmicutes bacterium]|nr:cation diffusion facilitator family transporter [Bacillota bacterium]MCM1400398.1 cation diffusion facilitator family transporter [Bacteroides sp.]MCM1477155.1 cation diffusion facilitator family transporter [Bacteroides sp.]